MEITVARGAHENVRSILIDEKAFTLVTRSALVISYRDSFRRVGGTSMPVLNKCIGLKQLTSEVGITSLNTSRLTQNRSDRSSS
jgi:hypothetical protein